MSLELDFAAMRVGVRNVRGDILMVGVYEHVLASQDNGLIVTNPYFTLHNHQTNGSRVTRY